MSEQKLVSPLLDGFRMGDPISSHDGVRCCPAIKENSDNKYIIKILSIPASQNQLEALLLTGAFQDAAGALNYFKELADGVVREAQLHQQLAKLDGFAPCEAWQVVPMDDNQLGYDVYLLTGYQRTLERHLRQNPMTHLEAVNLGLDLCAALAACRRAGYIYVDLKPSNIFISADKEYLIGDLGFISMDSLKYAALPSKYRSCYSAPEMHDVFATISDTADIYALGLILYQIYNDGQLPFDSQPPAQELPAPANADAEMAEIILKACAPDPTDRWQDPAQMGQALVAYMQRNGVNDDPIVPPAVEEEPAEEEAPAEEAPVEEAPAEEMPVEEVPAEEEIPAEEIPAEEAEPAEEEAPEEETAQEEELPAAEEAAETETPAKEEVPAAEEEPADQPADEEAPVNEETPAEEEMPAVEEEPAEEEAPAAEETEAAEEAPAAEAADEGEPDEASELAAIYDMVADETASDEETAADVEIENLSEEISAILAQADELVAHEIPEPVVVPEATLPEEEPEPEPVPEEVPAEPQPESDEDDEDDGEDEVDIPIAIPDLTPVKKRGKKLLVTLIILALLAGLGYGANYYYWNYYLVPVESIVLDGGIDEITAQVDVAMDESILTAVCTDTYGNTTTSPVENGQARFTDLKPGTQYTVTLKIDGFYKLSGNNAASFTTGQQTNIVSISATTGAEDGSVILSFTVDGTDPKDWTVEYGTEGEETQSLSFTGHMVTITGLTVDSTYTFRLMPTQETDVALVGTDTLEFTVSGVVLAQNVTIASFEEDVLTLRWDAPEGVQVGEWTVRCTSTEDESYDETLLVSEATAQFSGIEAGKPYTLEILAEGMTQSLRTDISAQPLAITDVTATLVNAGTLRITWEYRGDAPAEGWTVSYSIDGSAAKTLEAESNAADLTAVVPGASYEITVQPTGELAGVSTTYESPAADKFSGHGLTSGDLSHSLCLTPDVSGWDYNHVEQYTSTFSPSQSVSMVVYSKVNVAADSADTHVLYVVRDADGKVCLASGQTMNWKNMWKERYFYPTLPETPDEAGRYTFEVYFDGALAVSKNFNIS